MIAVWEKQFWRDDCKRTHMIKINSITGFSDDHEATLSADGDYTDQLRSIAHV
jgi:hypothetical protein